MPFKAINLLFPICALLLIQSSLPLPLRAEVLQGGVEEESYRLAHPEGKKDKGTGANADPLRLARAAADEDDDADLAKPQAAPLQGILDDFEPNAFDLGAERDSREMVLAWERWHHQFSAVLWQRWYAVNRYRGRVQIKITVTRDLHITVECLKRRGCLEFENTILGVVNSMDRNPGLTFPTNSQRQSVTFITNLTAGNVPASYTWDKSDFETVRKETTQN